MNLSNDGAKDWIAIEFTATDSVDNQAPTLAGLPKVIGKTIVQYGCGPEIFVRFSYPVQGDEEVLVKTTVRNRQTGATTTYYLEPFRRELNVGHSMCSGAFRFGVSMAYDVTFSYMDASSYIDVSGNKTDNSESIAFTKPTEPAVLDEPKVMPD